jgi:predicted nucleic acid-binding protein
VFYDDAPPRAEHEVAANGSVALSVVTDGELLRRTLRRRRPHSVVDHWERRFALIGERASG